MSSAYHSLHEYTLRMNRVLEHIDQHLDQPLELAELAQVAHFSPFHFHRLFTAWVGETLGDYLRRRRLACAAYQLASHPEMSILEVALEVGFSSGEAFSRAFKQHFSVTPSTWRSTEPKRWHRRLSDVRERRLRELSNPDQTHIPAFDDPDAFIHLKELTMNVILKELPPVRVAYLRYIGPYGPGIGTFWRDTVAPWMVENGLLGRVRYGIGHDDPYVTPPEKCRYDACVEVPADFKASAPAVVTTLLGGLYAVAHYQGKGPDIADAWTELCRDWLPKSGMQFDARPAFERYPVDAKYDMKTGELECEICIPVKAL
ncbi:Transcriptional regulator, AraC family [Pseudomonas chlororaphis subsp. aurantiaca]|uniref:AraC family transcriptional regulator n=1 Tax=Pseudomonas chlororaphis TaxID=587753 RepID=UPI000F55C47B|nr:AraC family transcriptional regulator [Pseudomonas chlororaphis]AZD20855.1 Transcriptional regulator, AraC family [Pseudomonas chlororaphis subsp. aurantiaca]AZD59503.1 Transcriptional regulator, AraC family [Pseudomonas chlororaphis subsp. aurantiaca]